MNIKLLRDDKRPVLEEITDDYIDTLKKELSQMNCQCENGQITKSYFRNIIKDELFTANGYKLEYIIKSSRSKMIRRKRVYKRDDSSDNIITVNNLPELNDPNENRYKNKTLPTAIKSLQKYVNYLLELLHSQNSGKNKNAKGTIDSCSEKHDIIDDGFSEMKNLRLLYLMPLIKIIYVKIWKQYPVELV
jgi:hypothetical protein